MNRAVQENVFASGQFGMKPRSRSHFQQARHPAFQFRPARGRFRNYTQNLQQRALPRPVGSPVKWMFCLARAADQLGSFASPVRRLLNAYFTGQADDAHDFAAANLEADIA